MWFATLFSAALLDSLGPWRLASALRSGTRGSGNYWRLNRVHQPSLKNLPPTRHHLFSLLHPPSTSLARMLFEPPAIIIKIKCSQSLPTSARNHTLHLLFHRLPGTAEDALNCWMRRGHKPSVVAPTGKQTQCFGVLAAAGGGRWRLTEAAVHPKNFPFRTQSTGDDAFLQFSLHPDLTWTSSRGHCTTWCALSRHLYRHSFCAARDRRLILTVNGKTALHKMDFRCTISLIDCSKLRAQLIIVYFQNKSICRTEERRTWHTTLLY